MENNKVLIQGRTEVKKSSIHGYGVFAIKDIKEGDIIEECHFMSLPSQLYDSIKRWPILRYVFHYPIRALGRFESYFFFFSHIKEQGLIWEKKKK